MSKRCAACGKRFQPRPQVKNQTYCSAQACQRERRRRGQQNTRQIDPDYRVSDTEYNKDWASRNPEYFKNYREDNPEYAERNRLAQQRRNQNQRQIKIAKENVSAPVFTLPSGRYRLIPVTSSEIANEDAWIVEITVLTMP
jgi:hypothetical protein